MRVTEPYIIFPRKLASGRIVYYYQYRDSAGHRSNPLSTGETVLSKARRKIQQMYNAGAFDTAKGNIKFGMYTENFFSKSSRYYEYQSLSGKPPKDSTLASYNKILNNQLLPFFSDRNIANINKNVIKDWVLWASRYWSAKTVNGAHGVLNIILESAVDKEIIQRNPLAGIKFRSVEKKQRELLTVEEISRIYKSGLWARESQRAMFLLAAITGMRIGEISALKKTDFHDDYIDVTKTYSDRFGLGSTKTGESRKVPLKGFVLPESNTEWAFEGVTSDKPMLSHAVYNSFSRIIDKLGIDRKSRGLTVHSLRNFFISYLQGENVPQPKIKAVAGHADKNNMTEYYTYWNPEMFPEVYAAQKKLIEQITGAEIWAE